MKRKITLLLCLFVALAIVLTGCPKVDEPAPVTPEDTTSFVRKHAGNDECKGFTEIYFDNFEEQLTQATEITIQRKTSNSNWENIYDISLLSYGSLFTELDPVIDYYAEQGTTYTYRIVFMTPTYNFSDSGEQSFKTAASFGPIEYTPGSSTYTESTGILTFSQNPSFTFTEPSDSHIVSQTIKYTYEIPGSQMSYAFNILVTQSSEYSILDIFNGSIDSWKNVARGQTFTYDENTLNITFQKSDSLIVYQFTTDDSTGFPNIIIPSTW